MAENQFRLCFHDLSGRVVRTKNARCADSAEAVALVSLHPDDLGITLWAGEQLLHTTEATARMIFGPGSYLLYLVNGDDVIGATVIAAQHDRQAGMIAERIYLRCDDVCDGYELWLGNDLIRAEIDGLIMTPSKRAPSSADEIDEQEKYRVEMQSDHEQRLRDTFQAIRDSRKLTHTLKSLKQGH